MKLTFLAIDGYNTQEFGLCHREGFAENLDKIAKKTRVPGIRTYGTGMVQPGTQHPWWYVHMMAHQICAPHFNCDREKFFGHQIMFMAGGRGRGSYADVKWEAGPGTAVLMDLNRPHTYITDPNDPWDMYWIIMEGPGIARVFSALIDAAHSPVLPCPKMKNVAATFKVLFKLLKSPLAGQEGWIARECATLLSLINEGLSASRVPGPKEDTSIGKDGEQFAPVGVAAAQRFMRAFHQRTLSLEECARAAHMSPYHFIRCFKQTTGFTPMQYLEKFRIGRAQQMLAEQPDLRLNEIARAVGFGDPAYFSRIFRKSTGQAPRAFRERVLSSK